MTCLYRSPWSGPGGPCPRSLAGVILTAHDSGVEKVEDLCSCLFLLAVLGTFIALTEQGVDVKSVTSWPKSSYNWCTWVTVGLDGKWGSPPLLLSSLSSSLVLDSRWENSRGTCVSSGYIALKWSVAWTEGQVCLQTLWSGKCLFMAAVQRMTFKGFREIHFFNRQHL